jgi:hypothetical protein
MLELCRGQRLPALVGCRRRRCGKDSGAIQNKRLLICRGKNTKLRKPEILVFYFDCFRDKKFIFCSFYEELGG